MESTLRKLFPYLSFLLCTGALTYALWFGTLPPADFTFVNGTEVESIDPAKVTGAPEGRIINALLEGLYRQLPDPQDPTKLTPQPAVAESFSLSSDLKTYTFKIRPSARWSNGDPVTADDFVWSWRRFLHPETASEYAYQLHYVAGARRFNSSEVEVGDRVEVELPDRQDPLQLFPHGTLLAGVLKGIETGPEPEMNSGLAADARDRQLADWRKGWIYAVEVKPAVKGHVDWKAAGQVRRFSHQPPPAEKSPSPPSQEKEAGSKDKPPRFKPPAPPVVERCQNILQNFDSEVAIHAADPQTLVVTLENPTPYFLELVAFYPLYPVHRPTVEKHGTPRWTKAQNFVGNGPFLLEFRRLRDRIRLVKNPRYWDADGIQLQVVDALAVSSDTTQLNMYMNGQVDWATTVPTSVIPQMKKRPDFKSAPMLTTYYYRINVTRKPLDNPLVRRALNLAMDKRVICEYVTKAGQQPARSFVPPGLKGYEQAECGPYNPEEARRLLAEAGYPGGAGFRKIQILYNTLEAHRDIAEVIQSQWKENLGIDVELKNMEWGVFLNTVSSLDYDVARAAWIGDYPDPNTFLDMFVTGGSNNQTGWGNVEYDHLIRDAASQADPEERLQMMHDAEVILMDQQPLVPIYFYVSINMVRPYVQGFHTNIQDLHPLNAIRIDPEIKERWLQHRESEQGAAP